VWAQRKEETLLRRRFCSGSCTLGLHTSIDFTKRSAIRLLSITLEQQDFADFNKTRNLVRDQEVEGSNPFAPTIFSRIFKRVAASSRFLLD
jgi:hypothetical protein